MSVSSTYDSMFWSFGVQPNPANPGDWLTIGGSLVYLCCYNGPPPTFGYLLSHSIPVYPLSNAPVIITYYRVTPNGLEPTTFGGGAHSYTVYTFNNGDFNPNAYAPKEWGTYVIKAYYPGGYMGDVYIKPSETSTTLFVHPLPPKSLPLPTTQTTTQPSSTPNELKYVAIALSAVAALATGTATYIIMRDHST